MEPLATLEQAKMQLNIDHALQDALITMKLEEATAIVLSYCTAKPLEGWTVATVPPEVRSAVLELVADLYADRGDVDRPVSRTPSPWDGYPPPSVRGKLIRWRRQVMA